MPRYYGWGSVGTSCPNRAAILSSRAAWHNRLCALEFGLVLLEEATRPPRKVLPADRRAGQRSFTGGPEPATCACRLNEIVVEITVHASTETKKADR